MTTDDTLTPERLLGMADGYRASRILLTAHELGIFAALGLGSHPSAKIAAQLRTDPRATDRLMNALAALHILVKKDGAFSNGSEARAFLLPGSPGHLGGLDHTARLWKAWGTMTEAVRAGTRVQDTSAARDAESFIGAMQWRAKPLAERFAKRIDLTGVKKILDVGGGSGVFAIVLACERDDLRATVLDLPDVVPIAERYIKQAGLSGRVDTLVGDLTKDAFPPGNDLIILSAILHMLPPDANRDLLVRAAAALNPGGRVAVREFLLEEDRTAPPRAALFALNMLVNTEAGDAYTAGEITAWMQAAGLGEVEVDGAESLVIGKKKPRGQEAWKPRKRNP
ncbi:MAG: methyltransferase [Planctomycetota bacterium]|jgi:predicted O-methyltransferase YrrM